MSNLSVTSTQHTDVTIKISDLPYPASDYSNFRYVFTQNDSQILSYNFTYNSSATGFELSFSNSPYLGFNWFSPATSYSVTVYANKGGNEFPIGPATFTTNSVSPPTDTITPSV